MKITDTLRNELLKMLMKNQGYTRMIGEVNIQLREEESGIIIAKRQVTNLVVTAGLYQVAKVLSSSEDLANDAFSHMGIGTGNTAPAAGNTDLETIAGVKQALSARTWSTNTVTFTATFAAGNGTGNITEAGIFNDGALATGDMLSRSTFAAVTKNAGDALDISWILTVTAT